MPSKIWSHKVETSERVESTADGASGDSVEAGEVPCDLRLVDGKVGGDRTVQTLAAKDAILRFVDGHFRTGGDLSAMGIIRIWLSLLCL